MRAACREAAKFGDTLIPMERNPTLVTVILNPVANKRKAKKDFEKYCEPLLHLAGLQVDVIQTASEGNAKEIVEELRGTEAIIVAGGDGTLSETITGKRKRCVNPVTGIDLNNKKIILKHTSFRICIICAYIS
jgi:acylglycerol kinase